MLKSKKKERKMNRIEKSSSHETQVPSTRKLTKSKRSKTAGDLEKLGGGTLRKQDLSIDDHVSLTSGQKGYIRYIGRVHFGHGQWFGIELTDGTTGNHDGKVGTKRYFETKRAATATFVKSNQIKCVIPKREKRRSRPKSKRKPRSDASTSNSLHKTPPRKIKTQLQIRPLSACRSTEVPSGFFDQSPIRPFNPRPLHNGVPDGFPNAVPNGLADHLSMSMAPPPPPPPPPPGPPPPDREHDRSPLLVASHPQPRAPKLQSRGHSRPKSDGLGFHSFPAPFTLSHGNSSSLTMEAQFEDMESGSSLEHQGLMKHRSCAILPHFDDSMDHFGHPVMKQHKSLGNTHDDGDGLTMGGPSRLSVADYVKNYDHRDPAVRKLKKLSKKIRHTQSRSTRLEEELLHIGTPTYQSPPALPPDTPHETDTGFHFTRPRSNSDSSQQKGPRKRRPVRIRRNGFHAIHRSHVPLDVNAIVLTENDDTDVEDMFNHHPPALQDTLTAGGTAGGPGDMANHEERKREESQSPKQKFVRHRMVVVGGSPSHQSHSHHLDVSGHHELECTLTDDGMFTPRAVGTDAFSRIRSKSIQSRLSAQSVHQSEDGKAFGRTRGQSGAMKEKQQRGICPFWNPFERPPHCPFTAGHGAGGVTAECGLAHLSKAEYLDHSSEEEMIELLQLLFCQSLPVEACSVIEKLLSNAPDNDEYNTCMGDILEELGRYKDSEKFYRRALELNPNYADVHNNYGMLLQSKLNRVDEAEAQYRECLKINAEHQVCLANYGKLLQSTGRYLEAEMRFKKCLSLNERNANCQHHFGVMLYDVGRWTEAKFHLSKAIELSKDQNASFHYNFGRLLCDMKEFGAARRHFERCLELEADNAAFNFEFGTFLAFDVGDIASSIQYLMRAYVLDPHTAAHVKMHEEITRIVADHGLSKPRRRRSSARIGSMNHSNAVTVVEYKEEDAVDGDGQSPCQSEFARFLRDNFSFGHCLSAYLERFKAAGLNDIRFLAAFDKETLIKDVKMSGVHAKSMMSKIDLFKDDNAEFISWLDSIELHEYYTVFEGEGILTFPQFYAVIQCKADLIRIMGDRNQFDIQLLWKSVPKFVRQSSSLSVPGHRDDHRANGHHLVVKPQFHSNLSNGSQIEGKPKEVTS